MTLGREPRPLDWWVSPGLLVPVLIPGSESFYPEWTKFTGSWKVNISTDPFPFHPNGFHFWKRDISEAAARYMWSKQNRVENSSHSDLLPPSALIYALDAGDPESTVAPSGPPASTVVRCVTRCVEPRLRPGMAGAAWGRPGSSAGPTLMPTSSSSVKLYFSYPEFGLIYIYTNIYINIYIYTVILLN